MTTTREDSITQEAREYVAIACDVRDLLCDGGEVSR